MTTSTAIVAVAAAAAAVAAVVAAGRPREHFDDGLVAIASMMRRPTDVSLWLATHRAAGVGRFYVRAEDSPDLVAFLRTQPDVVLDVGASDAGDNYNTQQTRQIEFVNRALDAAAASGDVAWLFHVDADELLDGDLRVLATVPASRMVLKIANAEALYDDPNGTCFAAKRFVKCDTGPCLSYANGKAGGRVAPGVRCAGSHDFSYRGRLDAAAQLPFEQLRVLHFDSCSMGAWIEKFAHMLKGAKKQDIPFAWYQESLDVAARASAVYRAHKAADKAVDPRHVFTRA
jgi:hypothetical protein